MIFAPYRNVLDFAHDVNGSDDRHRAQLAWDEIDYELGGKRVEQLNLLIGRVLQPGSWRKDTGRRDWGTALEGNPPHPDAGDWVSRDVRTARSLEKPDTVTRKLAAWLLRRPLNSSSSINALQR